MYINKIIMYNIYLYCNNNINSVGSCVHSGYNGCCEEGEDCQGSTESSLFGFCHCDKICYNLNDCCSDIADINCTKGTVC